MTEVIDSCDKQVPYIIKIDVEGFELEVLSTIKQDIFKQINFLWVEITPDGTLRGSSQDTIRKMIPPDFDMFRIIANGLILIANDATDHWSYNSNLFQNLFFARKGILFDKRKVLIRI